MRGLQLKFMRTPMWSFTHPMTISGGLRWKA